MQRILAVHQGRQARRARQRFAEELDALARQVHQRQRQAGHIAAGPCQIRHQAGAQGVAGGRHHDRNPVGRLHRRLEARRCVGDDHVDVRPHELGGERGDTLDVAAGREVIDRDIASLDVAEIAEGAAECTAKRLRRGERQHADARNPVRRLRRQADRRGQPERGREDRSAIHPDRMLSRARLNYLCLHEHLQGTDVARA